MTTRAEGRRRSPQLVARRLPGSGHVHHPAVLDIAKSGLGKLEPISAVCICAAGVDMITMLEPNEIAARAHLRHPSASTPAGRRRRNPWVM